MMNKDRNENVRVEDMKSLAEDVKAAFEVLSPYIQTYTAVVCPDCENVCCKDKHGRYDDNDLYFLNAMDAVLPPDFEGLKESDPCRYMTECGCDLERWRRPYRCTFFFCDALLKCVDEGDPKLSRAFNEYLKYLTDARGSLLVTNNNISL